MSRLNWRVIAAMLLAIPLLQGGRITPNVYTVRLGRCSVDWHIDHGIVEVACPGRDMIEVWPLPVEGA